MCSIDFDGPTDIHTETWPKARVRKKCCECSRLLDVGERYQRVSQLYDGAWTVWRTCASCVAIRKYLLDETETRRLPESEQHDDCQMFYYGGLAEACEQVVQELEDGGWRPPPHGPVAPPCFRVNAQGVTVDTRDGWENLA